MPGPHLARMWRLPLLALATSTAAFLAACGGDVDKVSIDGSSTVFPISEAVAEEFSKVANTRVNVAFSGTGAGFEKFCRGEKDISNASRPIKDSERAACIDNGFDDIVEFQVAIDALTVVVNPGNDFVDCLSVAELRLIFQHGGAERWSDVRPEWPDAGIEWFYPGTDSGTFDYFNEAIMDAEAGATHRGDGTSSEDDNILVSAVANDPNAIGYFGFAFFQESGQGLNAVAIDGGEGCVEPTFETALSGEYQPLSRPLFVYTRARFLAERPEVRAFMEFYLDNLDELVTEVGYVTMPDEVLAEQVAKLEQSSR